jgi:hypothetical protein
MPLPDIVEFMSNEKMFANTQDMTHTNDKKKLFQIKDSSRDTEGTRRGNMEMRNVLHILHRSNTRSSIHH